MFVLTFSPLGEKVNTIMVLIHQPVKKSTLGKIVNNHQRLLIEDQAEPVQVHREHEDQREQEQVTEQQAEHVLHEEH